MSATMHDLLAERRKRQQEEMHFPTAEAGLTFAAHQLEQLRDAVGTQLVVPAEVYALPLDQALAIVAACLRLHHELDDDNDERTTHDRAD